MAKKQANDKGPYQEEISGALKDMMEERPTYLDHGAVWDPHSLELIKK
jgi:hypothetical protein